MIKIEKVIKVRKMKLSKGGGLSAITVFFIPVLSVFLALKTLNNRNCRFNILIISLACSFIVINIPPYQDLYRRYYETYFLYNNLTDFKSVVLSHIDIIYYVVVYTVKWLGAPFFIIPMISVFVGVFSILDSLRAIYKNNEYPTSLQRMRLSYFILFCFISIITIALGLRFGCAAAIAVRGVIYYTNENKKIKSILTITCACLLHFSMLLILVALLISNIVKAKRIFLIPILIIAILTSNYILPILVSKITIFGIAQYAKAGYIEGKFAAVDTTLNSLIVAFWRYGIAIFLIFLYFKEENKKTRLENFIIIYIWMSGMVFVSYIAFNRYITEIGILIYALMYLSSSAGKINKGFMIILMIAIVNMLFNNIYLQRRPIQLGSMWQGLYTPIFLKYDYTQKDFDNYLKQIDSGGDWIGHELKSDQ